MILGHYAHREGTMAVLGSSRRRIDRATYVPLQRRPGSQGQVRRTLEKYAFLALLRVTPAEVDAIATVAPAVPVPASGGAARRRRFGRWGRRSADDELVDRRLLQAARVISQPGAAGRRGAMSLLTEVDIAEMVAFGRQVEGLRRRAGAELAETVDVLAAQAHEAGVLASPIRPRPEAFPADDPLWAWAQEHAPDQAERLRLLNRLIGPQTYDPDQIDDVFYPSQTQADCLADSASVLTGAFTEQMKVEPIGRLHLERLELSPAAIHRGELVYSLALAPGEQRRVTHREWSIRTQEFEEAVAEQAEEAAEESVTEKRELTASVESQSRRQTAFSLTASYTGLTVSGSANAESSAEDAQSHRQSRTDSMDVTRKASARSRRDHKVSFRATTQVGTETEEEHLLTNPSQTDAMRLDYFRLMREWQVDLYRYDLRLTFDIVIPHPGLAMLETAAELHRIDGALAKPFSFDVPFDAVTPETYQELGRRYGIAPPAPPPEMIHVTDQRVFAGQGDQLVFDELVYEVEADYAVTRAAVSCRFDVHLDDGRLYYLDIVDQPGPPLSRGDGFAGWDEVDRHLHLNVELDGLAGRTGSVMVVLVRRLLGDGSVSVTLDQELQPDAMPRWTNQTWLALREAAHEQWTLERQVLLDRRDRLVAEIGDYDALTLRKMEREAIMRGVLQWLFGPHFDVGMDADCAETAGLDIVDPSTWSQWRRVGEYGELIRFLQHAIEWENVIYLGYPYFWDSRANWDVKATLRHPDFRHQEFLRAGFFRVVLTVRRGFERDLVELTETGILGGEDSQLGTDNPYVTIAEDIRATAEELYPDPGADDGGEVPDQGDAEPGQLIGRWREYTPVSGLDLQVNTPLDTIA